LVLVTSLFATEGLANSTSRSAECLALAMYWDARGEGTLGMKAVGSVVLNRVAHRKFPDSVCGVVFQGGESPPCQFSWWCDGKSDRPRSANQWRHAVRTAEKLLTRRRTDPTRGALYFHSTSVNSSWHRRQHPTVRIGRHRFYR
jgi:N-acetylmuramoyl-L-alanine amidase